MTADQKSSLLKAFQSKKPLAGTGVVLVEGTSAETLREPNATPPKICVILQQLDRARSYWSESALQKDLALHLPKVGVPVSNPSYVCILAGTHAAFVGVAAPAATGGSALTLASIALKELNQELKPDGMNLQEKMQLESRVFTSVSNVLKTRHDTAKNTINNIR